MGTRGAYGFHVDNADKVTYNHFEAESILLGSPTPPAPAAGQRWRDTTDGELFTLVREENGLGWHDSNGGGRWPYKNFTNGRLQYVDSGAPADQVMGERRVATGVILPVACLECGADLHGAFHCKVHWKEDGAEKRRREWEAGARDFPRKRPAAYEHQDGRTIRGDEEAVGASPQTAPSVAKAAGPDCPTCAAARRGHDVAEQRYRSAIEEVARLSREVDALREPFRRKPKAEPWVPSVSDEDLLPDAGR